MTEPLPPYMIKVSQRARSVRLQISKDEGLVVTVPRLFNQGLLPGILRSKLDWINRTIERINQKPGSTRSGLPDQLNLRAINETWLVVYRTLPGNKITLTEQSRGRTLIISGMIARKMVVRIMLKSWLKERASRLLPDWLERTSCRTGLSYQGLTIRDQKTRWGSCSSLRNINLNLRLVFLPHHLVDYIMIHELSHTRVLSHSAEFWKQVALYYPDHKNARKELRAFAREIPVL